MADQPDPIEVAARALRDRDRSRRQIDERLERAGVDAGRRADALETLERVGYVDDERFATARASALATRGFGDEAIRQLLAGEGVPADAIDSALGGLEPERDRAARIVARLGSPRAAAALLRKGFAEDVVESTVGGFAEGGPEA